MHFILLYRHRSHHHFLHRHHQIRRLYDAAASITFVRDRGLDHAVEREKNLRPVLNLKNLIISEPSKSLPLSLIAQSKDSLKIPYRPIEFIRRYGSVFEEFLPGGIGIQPHIKLTPQVLNYDKEEQIIYQSFDHKQDVADRLLKLLMVSRINKIPLNIIDGLKWELGLPRDYVKTIVPEFPDYFRLKNESNERVLELVCWSNELAVSAIEKKGMLPIEFSLKYSNDFEMDKKFKKWVDEWQKLPYISPYENAFHLASKSDESDKWAVAVLHEILNLFVGRKAEREVVLALGECLGLRSRFKRALLQHPGIFYVSSKIGAHTVVLKEGYNRGMLIEKVPLVEMRFKYVQLMNVMKEDQGLKSVQQKTSKGHQGAEVLENDGNGDQEHGEFYELSDEESSDDYEDYDDDDDDIEHNERMNLKNKGPKKRFKRRESRSTEGYDDDNDHNDRTDSKNRGVLPQKRFKGKESYSREDYDDDNEHNERMRSKKREVLPKKRFKGKDSHSTEDYDDDNEHNERMRSNKREVLPKKRFKGKDSHSTEDYDDDNEHNERMRSKKREVLPKKRFKGKDSQSTEDYDDDNEHNERMMSKKREVLPKKRFKGKDSHSTEDYDDDNEHNERMRSKKREVLPKKRFKGKDSQSTEDYDDDNEHNERMRSKKREVLPKKRFKGKDSHSTEDYDDDNEHNERMNSKNRGALPKKRFKGRESRSAALRGSATRNSGENMGDSAARFNLKTEIRDSRNVVRRSQQRLDDDNEHSGRMNPKNRGALAKKRFKGKESQSNAMGKC